MLPTIWFGRPLSRRAQTGLALLVLPVALQTPAAAQTKTGWVPISNFEGVARPWTAESGPSRHVAVTDEYAQSGRRSLAVTMTYANQGRSVRQTWAADVGDLLWSADSRIRFWVKGSELAQVPHGGVIVVEAGGGKDGGDSFFNDTATTEIYTDREWHEYTCPPISTATDPGWRPDADGKLDPARIARLLFVAQQEAPPELNVPFTFYVDDVAASNVHRQEVRYVAVTAEGKPANVRPIQRGFKARKREHPPTVTFENVSGWRVGQWGGTQATMMRSEQEPCYEDLRYQAKLVYASQSGSGRFEALPPKPISVKGRFNAACAWVYGNNWAWIPDPATPPVHIWVRIVDAADQRHRIGLGVVNFKFYGFLHKRLRDDPRGDPGHLYWGGPADGKVHFPAKFEALEVHGGTNAEPRIIYVESVAFYQDQMELPHFRPELIKNLPFPTRPETILPTVVQPTTVDLTRDGSAYVFTIEGDERVVYRYLPQTGTLSDLTVQVAGRAPFTPCAGGGPVFLLAGSEREPPSKDLSRQLLNVTANEDGLSTQWRFRLAGDAAEFTLSMRARSKSLIVDWASDDPRATALRLGRAEGLSSPKLIRVPYLTIDRQGPAVLLNDDTFFITLLDWYNTECSSFYTTTSKEDDSAIVNGGASYHPLTDGTRNCLGERQFINVSSRFEEVLPNIPNLPSTQAEVTRTHLYSHLGGTAVERFDTWLRMWRRFHRHGIDKVIVTHHEDAWTDGADVGQGPQEYTMCIEAAPEVGDEKLIAYCQALRKMGYYIGLYENFTDYNPLGKSWYEPNAARNPYGELMRVWPPTYAIRPLKAVEMALDYPRRVAKKFGCNTAYRDCHTAYPPWGQVDYQAGTPGSGKLATNFRAWGALLLDGHRAYGGPIFSEGTHHWFFAGLVDGNYGQMGIPEAADYPLLLDFDLLKLHPLEADISMTPHWSWGKGIYHCQATTIAYGHIGFQPAGELATAGRYYYLIQQLQSRYVMVPAAEILYHRDGKFAPISEALKTDAHKANQVLVRYQNGLHVAVNCNPQQRWEVKLAGTTYDLSAYGWAAVQSGEFEEYCTELDGTRVGFVKSAAYCFADGGGRMRDFGTVATDGAIAVRVASSGACRVIVIAKPTRIAIEAAEPATVEAFDEAGTSVGKVCFTRDGARIAFEHAEQAESYLIR